MKVKVSVKASGSWRQNPRLHGKAYQAWLAEPVFAFDGANYTREQLVDLIDDGYPSTRAATNLISILHRFKISTLARLHAIGLDGLLRCHGIGERAAWVAACVLHDRGFDVDQWQAPGPRKAVSWRGRIVEVQSRTRHQKHA